MTHSNDAKPAADRGDEPRPPALIYPFATPPEPGRSIEIVPGVRWIRMPLPYALNHINLWSLDDGAGWALVDTGSCTEQNTQAWTDYLADAPDPRPLTRVLVTHMHPDHVGMAGWLTRRFDVTLWMTRLEYLTCRVMTGDTGREAPPEALHFYRQAGWDEASLETYRARFGGFGKHVHPMPDSFRRMQHGDVLRIGAHAWRVIVGSGHSPEHACLYCAELKLLISGDQVLPRISSNVSVYPTEPEADPMSDWLDSLDLIQHEVPDDVLVLPAHNECFRGLHARIDALRRGQQTALARLRRTLAQEPRRAIDVFASLFARSISPANAALFGMATGESLACLNHLVQRGEVLRDFDGQGVAWYRMAADSSPQELPS